MSISFFVCYLTRLSHSEWYANFDNFGKTEVFRAKVGGKSAMLCKSAKLYENITPWPTLWAMSPCCISLRLVAHRCRFQQLGNAKMQIFLEQIQLPRNAKMHKKG